MNVYSSVAEERKVKGLLDPDKEQSTEMQLLLVQMTQFGLHRVWYRKSSATTRHTINAVNWKIHEIKMQ